ncbi:SH3 domain-containing protein [Streptomyces sp. NPDC005047]|uniref:SH3 domain-containing protein n=1 Tax=Streptomyces parvulus TaxID=146923 RepID=UPI00341AC74F
MKRRLRTLVVAAAAAGSTIVASSPASAVEMVTTYEAVNQRDYPDSKSAWQGTYPANHTVLGLCWTWGETITDNGITNDVWVATGRHSNGRYTAWISAVYLKGDATGGVTNYCSWL